MAEINQEITEEVQRHSETETGSTKSPQTEPTEVPVKRRGRKKKSELMANHSSNGTEETDRITVPRAKKVDYLALSATSERRKRKNRDDEDESKEASTGVAEENSKRRKGNTTKMIKTLFSCLNSNATPSSNSPELSTRTGNSGDIQEINSNICIENVSDSLPKPKR